MADTAYTVPAGAPLISVEGLTKSFGNNVVLKGIDFAVMPGEVVTIIGASGSGKSTLLRCMNLLETPDSGHIWFHGEDLAADRVNINRLREKIGMVFQSFNLFNNKNVLDNCTLAPTTVRRIPKAKAEETAIRNLKTVGLEDFISFYIGAEEYGNGKPDPACYLMGAARAGVEPAECVVFEDATAGILAAKRAGMHAVALHIPGRPAQDLSAADEILEDLSLWNG